MDFLSRHFTYQSDSSLSNEDFFLVDEEGYLISTEEWPSDVFPGMTIRIVENAEKGSASSDTVGTPRAEGQNASTNVLCHLCLRSFATSQRLANHARTHLVHRPCPELCQKCDNLKSGSLWCSTKCAHGLKHLSCDCACCQGRRVEDVGKPATRLEVFLQRQVLTIAR